MKYRDSKGRFISENEHLLNTYRKAEHKRLGAKHTSMRIMLRSAMRPKAPSLASALENAAYKLRDSYK